MSEARGEIITWIQFQRSKINIEYILYWIDKLFKPHLSDTALIHFADIGWLRQHVHVWDSSQVHVAVDVETLCFSWRRLPLHRAFVHPQVPGLLDTLGHNSVPLAQRNWLLTEKNSLAWKKDGFFLRINTLISFWEINTIVVISFFYLSPVHIWTPHVPQPWRWLQSPPLCSSSLHRRTSGHLFPGAWTPAPRAGHRECWSEEDKQCTIRHHQTVEWSLVPLENVAREINMLRIGLNC